MNHNEVKETLKQIKLPFVISGYKAKIIEEDKEFELSFLTQHYVTGEYLAIYKEDECVNQGGFINQKQMNKVFRKDLSKEIKGREILKIWKRKIIEDNK